MERHFTWLNSVVPVDEGAEKFGTGIVIGVLLILLGVISTRRLRTEEGIKESIVPPEKMRLFGFFDLFIEGFIGFHDSILGKENRKYASFSGSIFIFLFALNLLGLIPGMPAATTTVWLTVGMAICVFLHFNIIGIKENGFWNYVKHFCGPIWWVAPLFFVVELFSTSMRILTLNLRLYWNITADHMVLAAITDLTQYPPVASVVYLLGTFVSFMQAFIFATLAMIYVLLATQHEEEH